VPFSRPDPISTPDRSRFPPTACLAIHIKQKACHADCTSKANPSAACPVKHIHLAFRILIIATTRAVRERERLNPSEHGFGAECAKNAKSLGQSLVPGKKWSLGHRRIALRSKLLRECGFSRAQLAWSSQTPPMCGNYVYQSLRVASGCCEGCLLPPSLADGRQTGLVGN
jgi:hypothetical protein